MQYIRKTAVGLLASLLLTCLIVFGVSFGIQRVFGTPEPIKTALKDSGLYRNIVADALDKAQESNKTGDQSGQSKDEIPLDRPEVKAIIQDAASPEFLQAQTESVLDSSYDWLQGKTPTLSFAIDMADVKTRLADGIAQYATDHLAGLPACTAGSVPSGDIDPFNATCLPQGADVGQVAADAKRQILEGDFLKDSKLTADSIKVGNNKTLEQKLEGLPEKYHKINLAVYGLGALVALLAVAILFLSASRRAGLKKLAILSIVAGSLVAALGWLASFGVHKGAETLKEPLQQSMIKVAQFIANDLRGWWMGYGITLVVLGIGTLIALRLTRPKALPDSKKPDEPTGETMPAETSEPKAEGSVKPKIRPSKKLVQ